MKVAALLAVGSTDGVGFGLVVAPEGFNDDLTDDESVGEPPGNGELVPLKDELVLPPEFNIDASVLCKTMKVALF